MPAHAHRLASSPSVVVVISILLIGAITGSAVRFGRDVAGAEGRIVNGQPAIDGQFPGRWVYSSMPISPRVDRARSAAAA